MVVSCDVDVYRLSGGEFKIKVVYNPNALSKKYLERESLGYIFLNVNPIGIFMIEKRSYPLTFIKVIFSILAECFNKFFFLNEF